MNVGQPLFQDSSAPSAVAPSPVRYVRVHGRNYLEQKEWASYADRARVFVSDC